MTEFYGGLNSFVRFKNFAFQYIKVVEAICEEFGIEGYAHLPTLERAHDTFVVRFDEIINTSGYSKRAIAAALIVELVNVTASVSRFMDESNGKNGSRLANYTIPRRVGSNVIRLHSLPYILLRYSDEVTALYFGTSIYMLETFRRTAKKPNCQLIEPQVLQMAQYLSAQPTTRKQFLQLILKRKK